jgi:hypothetical protein
MQFHAELLRLIAAALRDNDHMRLENLAYKLEQKVRARGDWIEVPPSQR